MIEWGVVGLVVVTSFVLGGTLVWGTWVVGVARADRLERATRWRAEIREAENERAMWVVRGWPVPASSAAAGRNAEDCARRAPVAFCRGDPGDEMPEPANRNAAPGEHWMRRGDVNWWV